MFVLAIAPLTGIPQPSDQLLHYFSKEKCSAGQLAEITLNRRAVLGVIFSCAPAETMRIAIKNSPYPLKNISAVKSGAPVLSQMQLHMALWISSYYYASLGVVLQAMLRGLGIKPTSQKIPLFAPLQKYPAKNKPAAALVVGECPDKIYRGMAAAGRQALPTGRQVLVLVPQRNNIQAHANKFKKLLPNAGIRTFHAGMKTTEQRALAREIISGAPLVIIGTRSALFLPFQNLSAIVVENPSDPSHTSWDQNPHYNAARTAAWLYENGFCSILFREETPDAETLHKAQTNGWNIIFSPQKKSSRGRIIDMREELKDGNKTIVSKNLQKVLAKSLEKKDVVFLFVQRRGFASGIVCRDCGFIVKCPSCNVPMVYHDLGAASAEAAARQRKFLLCHRCETKQQAPAVCPSCHGNRIRFIGAGTQRVEDEVKKIFPDLSVCRLDSDEKHSPEFLEKFDPASYGVIVGTSYAWSILPPQSVDFGAIITIDGLLSLPDYRSQERVYGIVEKMKIVTRQEYLVQTYCPEAPVFAFALRGDWDGFAKKELGLRKILKWPPFVQIIRMQYAHAQSSMAQTQAQQAERLLQVQIKSMLHLGGSDPPKEGLTLLLQCELLGPSPAYIDRVKNKFVWEIILKWPLDDHGEPQNLTLRNRLLAVLPRGWNIDVDPIDLV